MPSPFSSPRTWSVMWDVPYGKYRNGVRERDIVRATSGHPCVSLVDFPVRPTTYQMTVGEPRSMFQPVISGRIMSSMGRSCRRKKRRWRWQPQTCGEIPMAREVAASTESSRYRTDWNPRTPWNVGGRRTLRRLLWHPQFPCHGKERIRKYWPIRGAAAEMSRCK